MLFADLNSAAVLEGLNFNVEVDDALNKVISAEVDAFSISEAIEYCKKLHQLEFVANVSYKDEHFYSDDFVNIDFTDNKDFADIEF